MKLIDLLVQELPKRGGWPKGASYAVQHSHDLGLNWVIFGSGDCNLIHKSSEGCWRPEGGFCFPHEYDFKANILCDDHDTLVNREQYEVALAASKQHEWDGVGLPPVGEVIEYSCIFFNPNRPAIEKGQWYKGTVIAYYDDCVWTSDNGIRPLDNTQFRTIRTEAERIREEAARSMLEVIESQKHRYTENAYLLIYDAIAAGKIPGIKLAD